MAAPFAQFRPEISMLDPFDTVRDAFGNVPDKHRQASARACTLEDRERDFSDDQEAGLSLRAFICPRQARQVLFVERSGRVDAIGLPGRTSSGGILSRISGHPRALPIAPFALRGATRIVQQRNGTRFVRIHAVLAPTGRLLVQVARRAPHVVGFLRDTSLTSYYGLCHFSHRPRTDLLHCGRLSRGLKKAVDQILL